MEYKAIPLTDEEELERSLGRQFAYNPAISRSLQDPSMAVFIAQLYYWQKKKDPRLEAVDTFIDEGWTWKTKEEWFEETGLTKRSLDTIRKKLKEIGALEEKTERLLHRTYYRLVPAKINELVMQDVYRKRAMLDGKPPSGKQQTGISANNRPGFRETTDRDFVKQQTGISSIYKSTPKNTANTIPAMPECSSSESPDSSDPLPTLFSVEQSATPSSVEVPPSLDSSTPSVVDLPPTTSAAAPPFDSDQYIQDMMDPEKEKNPAVRLIGDYLFFLGNEYPSAKAIRAVIPRNISLAKKIIEEGWTEEEMEGLMESLANDPFWKNKRWTLSFFKDRLPKFRAELAAKKNQKTVRHL